MNLWSHKFEGLLPFKDIQKNSVPTKWDFSLFVVFPLKSPRIYPFPFKFPKSNIVLPYSKPNLLKK